MAQPTRQEIRRYMISVVDEHVDYQTDEVNLTTLAEDALRQYPDYEDCELFFEVSYEVFRWFERLRKRD